MYSCECVCVRVSLGVSVYVYACHVRTLWTFWSIAFDLKHLALAGDEAATASPSTCVAAPLLLLLYLPLRLLLKLWHN